MFKAIFMSIGFFFTIHSNAVVNGQGKPSDLYQATMQIDYNCGVVKIESHAFLTSASCFFDKKTPKIFSLVYDNNPHGNGDRILVTLKSFVPHPTIVPLLGTGYGAGSKAFDVAILIINEDTPLIPIAKVNYNPVINNQQLTLVGAGWTDSALSTNVHNPKPFWSVYYGSTYAVDKSLLKTDFYGLNFNTVDQFNFFTAGGLINSKAVSSGFGDEGGSVYDENGQLVGISIFQNYPDDIKKLGSVDSNVNFHVKLDSLKNWIETSIVP